MVTGKFAALPLATLQAMLTAWLACLNAIAVAHQSYQIAGRSFTRANLSEVSDMVAEIQYAISVQQGTLQRTTYADMSGEAG